MDNLGNFYACLSRHYQNSFFLSMNVCFLLLAPGCQETGVNCVTNRKMPKIYMNTLGHDKINLDLTDAHFLVLSRINKFFLITPVYSCDKYILN